jgi:hypothetical protein
MTMNTDVRASSIVVQKKDLPSTAVDGDLVILSFASNNYIGLDEIGRKIWESIETPRRVDELCLELAACFQGSPAAIDNDVRVFLRDLAEEGLIDVSHG